MIRVAVADDSAEMRTALRLLLNLYKDIEVVWEAVNGQEAIDCVNRLQPDVIVMDVRLPVLDGLEATKQIRNLDVGTRVILISFDVGDYVVDKATEAGANGYVRKDKVADQLLLAIEAVHRGEEFFAK